jgi:hypothetical protein
MVWGVGYGSSRRVLLFMVLFLSGVQASKEAGKKQRQQ